MSERDALLRAVRAAPDDDTPRLVYADWLDENGYSEQTEFIRLQLELEPIRHRLDEPRTRELIRHLDRIHPGWDRAEREDEPGAYWSVGLRRGLPDWAETDVYTLLARGENYRAEYPTVRELAVFDFNAEASTLAECPALAGLDVIELACRTAPGDIPRLAACPCLAGVGTLRLWIGWSDPLAEAFAATRPRPARVELVQLLGGVSAGGRAAELDAQADALAARVNRTAGRELARVVRPFDRAFPLCGRGEDDQPGIDIGGGMFAGRLSGGTPALVRPPVMDGEGWLVATFVESGGLLGSRDIRPGVRPASRKEVRRWLAEDLGLTPSVIQVCEFAHDYDFGVRLWPRAYCDYDGDGLTEGEVELYRWLKGGSFDVGGYAADWRGRLTRPTFEA